MKFAETKMQVVLVYIIFTLIFIILAGTGLSFLRKNKSAIVDLDASGRPKTASEIRGQKALYTELGRLRAETSDEPPGTLVIFPILEYNSEDKPFEEELVQKKEAIRQIILNWFSEHTVHQVYAMNEIQIKKELLNAINLNLNLSKLDKIYFKEFVILE